jgi:hypothetical protein
MSKGGWILTIAVIVFLFAFCDGAIYYHGTNPGVCTQTEGCP